jgi:hypothetical protein
LTIFESISADAIARHLGELSALDGQALLDSLSPHKLLPIEDPAGYLIATRENRRLKNENIDLFVKKEAITINHLDLISCYDIGVVFARSLLRRVMHDEGKTLPIISGIFNSGNKNMIDTFLDLSRKAPIESLMKNDRAMNTELVASVETFINRAKITMPGLHDDGAEELIRGCHDYICVVSLLEADEAQQHELVERFIGRSRYS